MHLFRKHTVLFLSTFVLLLSIALALPQLHKPQEIREHAQTSAGTQLFVSPSGNGDCSQASPCSLATANGKATPGTTIIALPGNYSGNFTTSKGGASGQLITFKSQTKYGAIITGSGQAAAVTIKQPFIRFQDFAVTGDQARYGFEVDANDVQIVGNHIHGITQWLTGSTNYKGGAGIDTAGGNLSNLLFDSNLIDHVGAPGSTEQLVHGMYLSTHVTNGKVTNNVICSVEDFGLHPYDDTEASGWEFFNNTIAFTGRGILQAPNGTTRNNIVYNPRGTAYDIRGTGNVVENNLASGGSGGTVAGVTSGDPMFVSANADCTGDFHLKAGSPAIDKGSATGAPQTDFEGKTRPQGSGVDMGAFESGGASGSPAPGQPSGVIVPSFVALAPCPTCTSPSISPVEGGAIVPSGEMPSSGMEEPSGAVANPGPSVSPCASGDNAVHDTAHHKHKHKSGGVSNGAQGLLQLIMQLLNLILKLLGGGQIDLPSSGVDVPSGTISEPSGAPQSPC